MKRLILALACFWMVFAGLKLTAAKASPEEYRLVQSQIGDEVPLHGPLDAATVYVLVCPDQRVYVFRAFHSHALEEVVQHFPRGSVLHYDGNALATRPPEAQIQALATFCKAKGIDLVLTPTN